MEQILPPGGVCDLGSINLTQFIENRKFNYDKIKRYVKYLVRFLDNVNDYSSAPLPEYIDFMRDMRRIGIGIMGWGSSLIMMGIKFASDEANDIRNTLMEIIAKTAYEHSIDLAVEKGKFKHCNNKLHSEGVFINSLNLSDEYMNKLKETGIRNSSVLSIQPTGNTGIFSNNVSGGLEPIFAYEYIRTVIVNETPEDMVDMTPKWYEGEWKETDLFKFTKEGDEPILRGVWDGVVYKIDKNRGLVKEVACKDYSVRYLENLGKWDSNADYVISALDLTANDHLNDLIGFMRYIDSSASKTINIPFEYSFEDFKNVYLDAYNSGVVKGLTTYRAGTMAAVLSTKETNSNGYDEEIILDSVKMSESSEATMKLLRAEGRKWYMTVVWNETKTRPFAIFVQTNHPEKTVTTNDAVELLFELAENKKIPQKFINDVKEKISGDNNSRKITRTLSLLLRHGVAIKNIVNTLGKVDNVVVGSFLFQITKYLAGFIKDGEKVEKEKCPACELEGTLVYREGCKVCSSCGSSKCG
jgi:ribonucleoside-diphosphate reductase alpha chain